MKPQDYQWSSPQRQSPWGLILVFIKTIRSSLSILLPYIVLQFLGRSRGSEGTSWTEYLILATLAFILINTIIDFWFYRFSIESNELVIRKGFLKKVTITIPLQKIQAVQLEQNLFHKLTGIARISIDSPGTHEAEVKIDSISLKKAAALQHLILDKQEDLPEETLFLDGNIQDTLTTQMDRKPYDFDQRKILQLGIKDLMKLSISSNHLEAFLLILAFLFSIYDQMRDFIQDKLEDWFSDASQLASTSTWQTWMMLCFALLLLSIVVSTLRTFFTYFNYFVSARNNGYRIYGGLIQVKERMVPYNKIQFISWRTNWLRSLFDMYILQYHVVGSEVQKKDSIHVKVPVTQHSMLEELTNKYGSVANLDKEEGKGGRMEARPYVWSRTIFIGVLPAIVIATAVYFLGWSYPQIALFWAPYIYLQARLFSSKMRFYRNEEELLVRTGVYGIRFHLLKWKHIQMVEVSQTRLQKKLQIASLKLVTAGGTIRIPWISSEEAFLMADEAAYQVEKEGEHSNWL